MTVIIHHVDPVSILAAVERLRKEIGPEPIGEWMREQGYPPETSLLLLPYSYADKLPWPPACVRFNRTVTRPVLVNNPGIGTIPWGTPSAPPIG
jgi:hypothetical protein